MNAITPESFSKRSFVYRKLTGASFTEMASGAVAAAFINGSSNDSSNGRRKAEQCGLMDLSVLPRTGFRGSNASAHVAAAGLPTPEKPNQASVSDNGELVLRLSQSEFWVLASLGDQGSGVDTLSQRGLPEDACYPLYCQDSHAWFTLTGIYLPDVMAKVCGVDLREEAFPVGSIAQTSVARVNVVIVHHEVNDIPCFSILSDSASAEYLWESLLDAMGEFGGDVIGADALS